MGIKAELLDFLIKLPATDSPDECQAMVTATGYADLGPYLNWGSNKAGFFGSLLHEFGKRGQSALVQFLDGMEQVPHVSYERKSILAELRARVAALDAAGWLQEFAATPPFDLLSVTIKKGATVDEIIEAFGKAGLLPRVTERLPEAPFRRLLDIVSRVTLADTDQGFFRVYCATLPPTAHVLNNPLPALLLTDLLCERPRMKAWPPLIEFIERLALASGVKAAPASELQRWVDANAGLVVPPTPTDEIERLRRVVRAERTTAESSDATSWLQVYLEPDWLNRTQDRKQPLFLVELVLWSPKTNGAPYTLPTDKYQQGSGEAGRLWTLDELPTLLDQVLADPETVNRWIPDILQLVIEVVAPSDVLQYGFERWKRNGPERTYGAFRPLVVRLRDRLAIPDATNQKQAKQYWRDKWNAFRSSVCREGCEKLEWQAPDELDTIELQEDADLACLGLSSPLMPERHDVFDVLRDAGIPIALWLRGHELVPSERADLQERIKALIQGKPLSELYKKLHEVRRKKEVRTDERHIGNAITLLWDDPDRSPPKYDEQGVFV